MLLRTAYLPNTWTHRISVYSRSGDWKQTKDTDTKQNIAGPLCFSGDVIAMNRPLPIIEVDDYLVLHDAGAYTLSMWSHYNSRQSPTVYSYEQDQNQLKWTILRNRDSIEEVLQFWKQ